MQENARRENARRVVRPFSLGADEVSTLIAALEALGGSPYAEEYPLGPVLLRRLKWRQRSDDIAAKRVLQHIDGDDDDRSR